MILQHRPAIVSCNARLQKLHSFCRKPQQVFCPCCWKFLLWTQIPLHITENMFFRPMIGWITGLIRRIDKKQVILIQHFPMIFRQRRIQRHIRTALYVHSNRGDSDRRQDGQNQRKQNAHNKCKIHRHIARRTLLSLAPGLIYTGYSTMHVCVLFCFLPHIFPAWDVILPKIFVTSSVILSLKISTSPVATKINNTTSTVPTPSSFLNTSYTLLCSFHAPFTARFFQYISIFVPPRLPIIYRFLLHVRCNVSQAPSQSSEGKPRRYQNQNHHHTQHQQHRK